MAIKYTDLVQNNTKKIHEKASEIEEIIDLYLIGLDNKEPDALSSVDLTDLVEWKGLGPRVITELCRRYDSAGWVLTVGWARDNEMKDYTSATLSNKTYRGA